MKLGNWLICPTCSGDGSHAQRLGVVNPEEWSDDEWEDYMGGAYDDVCESCQGSGKVREGQKIRRNRYFETQAELDHFIESGGSLDEEYVVGEVSDD